MARRIERKMGRAMKFLVALNCFTTLMGISMLIASAYARAQFRDDGWGSLVSSQGAASLGIATGLFTLVLSVVGCVGAAARQKRMLCCYMCGLLIVFSFQIAAAVTMSSYASTLSFRDERGVNASSSNLMLTADIALNNAVLSVYVKCCSGCPNNVCNNPTPGSFFNGTLPYCSGNTTCTPISPCGTPNRQKCFVYPPGTNVTVPPLAIPDTLCSGLGQIWLGKISHAIVGPAFSGSCGAGDPVNFFQDMDTFVWYSLNGVAGFFTFVAVIEGLALIAGMYIIFCSKTAKVQGEDDEQVFV